MKKQGMADRTTHGEGAHREPRPYAINPNFPSQLGSAIDPMAAEKIQMGKGYAAHIGPTDGMEQGPGGNRSVKPSGGQGHH
jgi:hypothetical protein